MDFLEKQTFAPRISWLHGIRRFATLWILTRHSVLSLTRRNEPSVCTKIGFHLLQGIMSNLVRNFDKKLCTDEKHVQTEM